MINDGLYIGVDIECINRFRKLNRAKDHAFLNRIFTKDELAYCFSKTDASPHLVARFAGKEAVFKALSSLKDTKLSYRKIEILNKKTGVPFVNIKEKNYGNLNIKISLSHCKNEAVAFVIITCLN